MAGIVSITDFGRNFPRMPIPLTLRPLGPLQHVGNFLKNGCSVQCPEKRILIADLDSEGVILGRLSHGLRLTAHGPVKFFDNACIVLPGIQLNLGIG